jgi:hypothetical protein
MSINREVSVYVLVIALILCAHSLSAQTRMVTGSVLDAATGEPLSFASLHVENSKRGTTTDKHGRFTLSVDADNVKLHVTYLGYLSAMKDVALKNNAAEVTIKLTQSHIALAPVTVTPGDNPALRIVKLAIERKKKLKERIENYSLSSHSKLIVRVSNLKGAQLNNIRDSAFSAIMETQTDAYWAKPNRYKEIVKARKQSAFIPAQSNIMISQFFIIDFSSDALNMSDRAPIVGPISDAGLRNYDYTLRGTTRLDSELIYMIDIKPLDENDPLLQGTIYIADGSYALMMVDLSMNDAALPTFFKGLHFKQNFHLVDQEYWMPADVIVDAEAEISVLIVSLKLKIEGFSVLQDYAVNQAVNEEVFDRTRIKVLKEADKRDSVYWAANQKIPNTAEELLDYKRSDSVKARMDSVKNQYGIGNIITGKTFSAGESFINVPGIISVYRFNRVEGHAVYLPFSWRRFLGRRSGVSVDAGYGFDDKRWKYDADVRAFSLRAGVFDRLSNIRAVSNDWDAFTTTVSNIFWKYDYKDYYYDKGWRLGFDEDLLLLFPTEAFIRQNSYANAVKTSDWSLTRQDWEARENPPINEGKITSVGFSASFDDRDFIDNAGELRRFGSRTHIPTLVVEHGIADLTAEKFSFTKVTASLRGQFDLGRVGSTAYRLMGSLTAGKLPTQSVNYLMGSVENITAPWNFRTLAAREYGGDRIATLFVEHDFGDQLFRWLHIPLLNSSGWGLVAFGAAGWTTMSAETRALQTVPTLEAKTPMYEVGLGIDKIFLLLRIDVAWRLNHYRDGRNFFVGISTPVLN